MHIDQFDYTLPPELIAQEPPARRDEARLLVLCRGGAVLGHRRFDELPELLRPGDLLVLNDTRVIAARLLGRRARTQGKWEGLFLRATAAGPSELLCQTRGRLNISETLLVDPPGPTPFSRCRSRASPGAASSRNGANSPRGPARPSAPARPAGAAWSQSAPRPCACWRRRRDGTANWPPGPATPT